MDILNPIGLVALVSLPLLYLLVVLLRRPRRLVVSSLIIWKRLPRPAPALLAHARRRITLSFVFLALGLALAALALARPVLTAEKPPSPKVVIALDTSASMLTADTSSGRARWTHAIKGLDQLLKALPTDVDVTVVTEDPLVPVLLGPESVSKLDRFLGRGFPSGGHRCDSDSRLWPGDYQVNLEKLVKQAAATAEAVGARDVFVFSDHEPTVDTERSMFSAPRSLGMKTRYLLYGGPSENVGIVHISARLAQPGQADCLVRVGNFSPRKKTVRLAVVEPVNPSLAKGCAAVTFEIPPEDYVEHVFEGLQLDPAGTGLVAFQITPEGATSDELACDNVAGGHFVANPKLRVCLVSAGNSRLERALLATGTVKLETHEILPNVPDDAYDLYVFDRVEPLRLPKSRVVLVKPPADCPPFRFGAEKEVAGDSTCGTGVSPVMNHGQDAHATFAVSEHALMQDVRLDTVRFRRVSGLELMPEAPGKYHVLASQGGTPLLGLYEDDLTGLWLLAIPVDVSWRLEESDTDWATLPAFPIFWANLVEQVRVIRDKQRRLELGGAKPSSNKSTRQLGRASDDDTYLFDYRRTGFQSPVRETDGSAGEFVWRRTIPPPGSSPPQPSQPSQSVWQLWGKQGEVARLEGEEPRRFVKDCGEYAFSSDSHLAAEGLPSGLTNLFFANLLNEDESNNAGTSKPFDPSTDAAIEKPPESEGVTHELTPWLLVAALFCFLLGWRG